MGDKGSYRKDGLRECTMCLRLLPIEEFYHNRDGWNGRMARCKDCENARAAEARMVEKYKNIMQGYHSSALDTNVINAKRKGISYGRMKAELRRQEIEREREREGQESRA